MRSAMRPNASFTYSNALGSAPSARKDFLKFSRSESHCRCSLPTANLFSIGETPGAGILSHSQVVEDETVPEREFAHHCGDGLSGFLQ